VIEARAAGICGVGMGARLWVVLLFVPLSACGRTEEERVDASDDVPDAAEGAADVRIVDVAYEEARIEPNCWDPADVSGFMPPPFVPPNPPQMKCDSAAIQGYYDNCLGAMATNMKCTAFRNSNMACATCLMSAKTDASWGPLVYDNGAPGCNVAGCVDLKGGGDCAAALEALHACQDAAECGRQCPVQGAWKDFADIQKCIDKATLNGCSMYAGAVTLKCTGSAYASCINFSGFQDCYSQYAELWCGAGG